MAEYAMTHDLRTANRHHSLSPTTEPVQPAVQGDQATMRDTRTEMLLVECLARMAKVYVEQKRGAPAESVRTGAGASDGNSPVASRQLYDTPAFHQEQA